MARLEVGFRLFGVRALWGVLALVTSIVTAGCTPDGGNVTVGFEGLNGLFIADKGVYVVPETGWGREGDHGGSFRKTASILIYVQNDQPDGLRVSFTPDEATRRFHFAAHWDEAGVWLEPRSIETGDLVVEVGGAELAPGIHHLRLDRERDLDSEGDRDQALNLFTRVQIERIDEGVAKPQGILLDGFLARFLNFGVTSQTSTRLSGCLFRGSQEHSFEVEGGSDGLATFSLQNQSRESARFIVEIDGSTITEVEVPARGRSAMEFPVPAGRRSVTLAVDGIADGRFLWGAPHLQRRSDPAGPPVILITVDTTRRDAIPPYSSRPDLTPVLDRFAQSATVYSGAYATAPWTLPSHASVFTGLYPSHHRAGVADDVLSLSWITLAEIFRGAGYRTAGFVGGSMASSRFGLAQGFDFYCDPEDTQEPANIISDAAMEFIENYPDDQLFLFLNYFDPHTPYSAPEEFQDLLDVKRLAAQVQDDPAWAAYSRDEPGGWDAITAGQIATNEAGLEYLRARYLAEVAFMDQQIGRVFETLKANGLFDEALIVIVADHGEFLGERGLYSHSFRLDRELTAIPLMVKWPHQKDGAVVDAVVSHVDLYPTIAAAAGLDAPISDGVEFFHRGTDGLVARANVYMEEHESRFHQLQEPFWIADHLYGMQWLDAREVFYPGFIECSRLSGGLWSPDECRQTWERRIDDLPLGMQESMKFDKEISVADLDEEEAEKLRALGYLH